MWKTATEKEIDICLRPNIKGCKKLWIILARGARGKEFYSEAHIRVERGLFRGYVWDNKVGKWVFVHQSKNLREAKERTLERVTLEVL